MKNEKMQFTYKLYVFPYLNFEINIFFCSENLQITYL